MTTYFSDRELGPKPRTEEQISRNVWGGIFAVISKRIDDGSFGFGFPEQCPDGRGVSGCDFQSLSLTVQAEIPDLSWPFAAIDVPNAYTVFDLLELLHRNVGYPTAWDFHSFFGHSHLNFDQAEGQRLFREDINRIFARNGLAYELRVDGQIIRLAPEVLRDDLIATEFRTGDDLLDRLLNLAIAKFLDPRLEVRKEALEKLWDAWERLKTLEVPTDKKQSILQLIGKATSESTIFTFLESEAKELTGIGNTLMIRHTEIGKVPIPDSETVDYLFHRLYSIIMLLLRRSGRVSRKSVMPPSKDTSSDDFTF